ncbi:MAG: hypothetical protein MJ220_04465 [Bacilli bacterium]|nr:hypothetical protein [Bacilli bacterium]
MKKGKLLSLFLLAMANMVGLSLVTFAWFTAKQKVDNGTNNIVAVKEDIIKSVNYYPYDQSEHGTKTLFHFLNTPVDSKDLGKYSIINSGYQLLIEIELYSEMNVSVTATTSAESYLGSITRNDDGDVEYTLKETGNSLSSIVCFYGFNNTDIESDGEGFTVDLNSSISGMKNFINEDYTDLIESKSSRVCEFNATNKFYIVMDYDEMSVETVYSANLGNPVTSGDSETMTTDEFGHAYIEYVTDFSIFVTKVEGGD